MIRVINIHALGNNIEILDIKSKRLYILESLPFYHRGPFDRATTAQGMTAGCAVLANGKAFDPYRIGGGF